MTLYQITDVINGINSNIIASQAIFLTIVSAYLVVAYSVGKSLTRYQAGFVSFVFVLFMFVDFFAASTLIEDAYELNAERLALLGEDQPDAIVDEMVRWVFIAIRLVITSGALIFMWQVRHSRADR